MINATRCKPGLPETPDIARSENQPTKALFLCGKARMRSPTAADLANRLDGVEADFAGLSNDADEKLSREQVAWAEVICVMEPRQKKRLTTMFGRHLAKTRLVVLNIPDRFDYMDQELVDLLTPKIAQILKK